MAIDTDWYLAEIEAVRTAIASGTTRVSYDGKSVEFGSRADLMARLRWLIRQMNGGVGPSNCAFASFDRGDE